MENKPIKKGNNQSLVEFFSLNLFEQGLICFIF